MMKITESKKDESIAVIEKARRRYDDGWPFEVYFSQNQVEHIIYGNSEFTIHDVTAYLPGHFYCMHGLI
jgi:hypothetical protein